MKNMLNETKKNIFFFNVFAGYIKREKNVDYDKIGRGAVDYKKVNKCKNRKNKKRDFWQINGFRFGNLSLIKKGTKKKYERRENESKIK